MAALVCIVLALGFAGAALVFWLSARAADREANEHALMDGFEPLRPSLSPRKDLAR